VRVVDGGQVQLAVVQNVHHSMHQVQAVEFGLRRGVALVSEVKTRRESGLTSSLGRVYTAQHGKMLEFATTL
jgi:hypothetical protein